MNVLYLHQYFTTRAGTGGTRSYEFARRLVERGDRVTMVTARSRGAGIEARGRQVVDGIEVLGLGGSYANTMGTARRLLAFARFTLLACLLRTSRLEHRPDVVVATSTPLTIGIPGAILARRLGVPFVFEVRDLWPQAPIELGALKGRLPIALARQLERWLYRRADAIIALSPGMEAGVVRVDGRTARKTVVVPNASDVELFTPEARDRTLLDRWGLADRFVAVHGGSMGRANGLMHLVDGMVELARRGDEQVHLVLAGYGGTQPALEARVASEGLRNVTFTGSIPRQELAAIVSSCDCACVSFEDLPVLATNSPNKLFDALAAGLPTIVNSAGWTRDLVRENDCGEYVDVNDPAAMADALQRLASDVALRERQGANARRAAETLYSRDLLFARFASVLDDVIAKRRVGVGAAWIDALPSEHSDRDDAASGDEAATAAVDDAASGRA